MIATEFFTPIREQGYGMHLVMMNTKMADRIFSFLDSVPARKDNKSKTAINFNQIDLQNISLAYEKKQCLVGLP